ncbi:MAG: zinc ribbon domain-containing protein [Phycisphaerae bacterium]
MPIFEYRCSKCGKIIEHFERNSDKSPKTCPNCGGKKMEKQFSVFSAQVKQGESKRCMSCSDAQCPHAGRNL